MNVVENINNIDNNDSIDEETYSIRLFCIDDNVKERRRWKGSSIDFEIEVAVHRHLVKVLADTGAKVSVCGAKQAYNWDILKDMERSKVKIHPYKSEPISVKRTAWCSVAFGDRSVPVEWNIINGDCEPIISGTTAVQLGIIELHKHTETVNLVNMIKVNEPLVKERLQRILAKHTQIFYGIGKLKDYQVKFYVNENIKPVVVPPSAVPYHLKSRYDKAINEMIEADVIEEHPINEPALWISNSVIAPKPNDEICITLDARSVNKAIQSNNHPIP